MSIAESPPRADAPRVYRAWRLRLQFVAAVAWFGMGATVVWAMTGVAIWKSFGVLFGLAIFAGTMEIVRLARWAWREGAPGQFRIATLLCLMLYVSLWLGLARWLTGATNQRWLSPDGEVPRPQVPYAPIALMCLIYALISIPIVLRLMDSLIWFSVWLMGRNRVRRALAPWITRITER